MEENQIEQEVDLGSKFVDALALVEDAEKAETPLLKAELLSQAVDSLKEIVERVTLFGAATNVCLQSLVAKLQMPGVLASKRVFHDGTFVTKDQVALQGTEQLINTVVGNSPFFAEEAEFCRRFELMARGQVLMRSGIDPSDTVAVSAFADKVAKAFILTPGNSEN